MELTGQLLEIRDSVMNEPDFLSAWDGMIETKSLEHDNLKQICAMFYFFGYKACIEHDAEEEE